MSSRNDSFWEYQLKTSQIFTKLELVIYASDLSSTLQFEKVFHENVSSKYFTKKIQFFSWKRKSFPCFSGLFDKKKTIFSFLN